MDGLLTGTTLAVLGAAISVIFNQISALLTRRSDRKALAYAIAAELDALQSRYVQSIEGRPGELFDYGFEEPRFDYFVVFEANSKNIGTLNTKDASDVVRIYVLAKGHFENVINWTKWRTEDWANEEATAFKTIMKKDHDQLMSEIPELSARLRSY